MRKNVKVVGIGQRMMGTGKTGRSYDFTPVSICYPDERFTGYRAATANIQTVDIHDRAVQLNTELDMVFHFANGNIVVDAIL